MDTKASIGISDLQIYVPEPHMPLTTLIERRVKEDPKLKRHLERAMKTTGQKSIRFPSPWEDSATMAAEAASALIDNNPKLRLQNLRYLVTGTETGLDHSKPLSAYVSGMLERSGYPLPRNMTSYQVQHACAGATLGLVGIGSMIGMRAAGNDAGIVIASDIARYSPATTAEVTQGAGAAAVLIERDPDLMTLDFSTVGYASVDSDDFFRPIGSKVAQVKGRYSMECYIDALENAFADHACQRGEHTADLIKDSDMFVLHTPFRNMPKIALEKLIGNHLGLSSDEVDLFLESRGFQAGIDAVARVGNTYSASLYIALAATLADRYKAFGKGVIGEKITIASYGSGNTMVVISGVIAERAVDVISSWDIDSILDEGTDSSFESYSSWLEGPYIQGTSEYGGRSIPSGGYYLAHIREDGYRVYESQAIDEEPALNDDIGAKERIAVVA